LEPVGWMESSINENTEFYITTVGMEKSYTKGL
jgi:hypothetical protein